MARPKKSKEDRAFVKCVSFTPELWKLVKAKMDSARIGLSQVVRRALWVYLDPDVQQKIEDELAMPLGEDAGYVPKVPRSVLERAAAEDD